MIKRIRTSFSWARWSLKIIRFWPPYLGTGIYVDKIDKNLYWLRVKMKLAFYNRNIVGVQFGGSLYSMCDPFLMYLIMLHMGEDYIVWDKAASIKFIKPGRTSVEAHFEVTPSQIEEFKKEAKNKPKLEPVFNIKIKDKNGEIVAEVTKTIYIRKK